MKTKVILVTGSRDWIDYAAVARKLAIAFADAKNEGCQQVIVRHGACRTGADAFAVEFVNKVENSIPGLIIKHDPHEAKWAGDGSAGPIRNKKMVQLGADLCLAFIGKCTSSWCKKPGIHPSHGASGCATLAEKAGIHVDWIRSQELLR
jgi:hypothetical protein